MSEEQSGQGQTGEQRAMSYDAQADYNNQLNARIATAFGQAVIDAMAAQLRSEFSDRQTAGFRGQMLRAEQGLEAIEAQVSEGRAHLSRLEVAMAEVPPLQLPAWYRDGGDPPPPEPPEGFGEDPA